MDENRVVLYSLLAYINDYSDSFGFYDLSDFLIPLLKRSLSKLYENGVKRGQLKDVKNCIDDSYSIDIPYSTLLTLLKKIGKEANKTKENQFVIYSDGSFDIQKFTFFDFEEIVQNQESKIKTLEKSYRRYLDIQNLKYQDEPSIFEFLDRNRLSLSDFFTKKIVTNIDAKYVHQANFIKLMKDNHEIYDILKKIYLGSIISTYFEINIGSSKKFRTELLLDTNFLIGLFDLHSEEATHTCNTLINICKKLGYKLTILDFTIAEATQLLRRISNNLSGFNSFQELDNYNIYSACVRRNLSKTKLEKIIDELEDNIKQLYKFHIYQVPEQLFEDAKRSKIFKSLKKIYDKPGSVLHDTIACMYVKNQRKNKNLHHFSEANCWFVKDIIETSPFQYNSGLLRHDIRSDDLLNILWLSNTKINHDEIANIGLTKLVSSTINQSLPSSLILKRLDDYFKSFSKDEITPEECARVANYVATKTIENLQTIEKLTVEPHDEFLSKFREFLKALKEKELQQQKDNQQRLEELHITYQKQIKNKEKTVLELEEQTKILRNDSQKEKLISLESEYNNLKKIYDSIYKSARNSANYIIITIIGFYLIEIGVFGILINHFGWSKIEPYTFFAGFILLIFPYIYFYITQKEFNPFALYNKIIDDYLEKKYNFNMEYYNQLEKVIKDLKCKISQR